MTKRSLMAAAASVLAIAATSGDILAQPRAGADRIADLRLQIERRFDVLPLHDGVALRPKASRPGVRSIELTDGTIAIDGVPATGAELRDKLGADADLVLRLSYLDAAARRELFSPGKTDVARPPPPSEEPAAPAPPAPPTPPAPRIRTRHAEARVRIGGSVTVEPDEQVSDVVVIGGAAHVLGEVERDVVVIGGAVELGPEADVGRDVTVIGGGIRREPGARIRGRVNEVGPGMSLHHVRWPAPMLGAFWFGSLFALVATVTRFAVLSVLASLVMLVGRDYVARVAERAAAEPIKAGVVGVLAQLLFLPLLIVTIVILVITIVGIPLLALIPVALLALALVFLIGFTAVAYHVGALVSARLGSPASNPFASAIVGILAVMSPLILARIVGIGGGLLFPITAALLLLGFAVEYLAWTVGFGAVALNRFDKR